MLKLQHVSLIVADLAKTRAFYGDFMGMRELKRPGIFKFDGAWFESDGTEVHMILEEHTTAPAGLRDGGEGAKTGLATHFAFEVDDVYAWEARAKEMGVPIAGGPMLRGDGIIQMYMYDPDRYLVELFQNAGVTEGAVDRPPVNVVRESARKKNDNKN